MATSSPVLGRPADRTNLIVRELRGQIVAGFLPPGTQLPTRLEIEASYGAGASTVQKALEFLRRDGFVKVHGRQGTFVADNPPHLTNYALIFPDVPDNFHPWKRFWAALIHQIPNIEASTGLQIKPYYGISKGTDNPDYLRLVQEVRGHRLAGLIFASNPFLVEHTPILDETGLQRVAIMAPTDQHKCRSVCPDNHSFWSGATQVLAQKGHKRVAVLMPSGMANICSRTVKEYLTNAGLGTEDYWIQSLHLDAPQEAAALVHLMFCANQKVRPDALIIADDNLVDFALQGIQAAGVTPPQDLEIVAHCNFPLVTPAPFPVIRLGFDANQVLAACINNLSTEPSTLRDHPAVLIPALLETEYQATGTAQTYLAPRKLPS